MKYINRPLLVLVLVCLTPFFSVTAQTLNEQALVKITALETLMSQARNQNLDVTREETAIWMAREFLKYADWDAANITINEAQFATYNAYKATKTQLATSLPDFERQEVINMLNKSTTELTAVVNGDVVRRTVPKIDWANILVGTDQFTNSGKPVFLYDYFSKTPEITVGTADLYNDHLGSIYHPRSISPAYCNENMTIQSWQLSELLASPDKNTGYSMLWHSPCPTWAIAKDAEIQKGTSIFINYDIDNPTMRSIWNLVLETVGKKLIGRKTNELGYCLANEPHWYSEAGHWTASSGEMQSVSTYTLTKFRTWLSVKHNANIATLNALWKTNFISFDNVTISIPISTSKRGTAEWYDWCRFNMDRGTEWLTSLHDALLKGNPDAKTHVKIMPDLFTEEVRSHGIDVEAITELTEMIGDDAKTRKKNNNGSGSNVWADNYAYFWEELAVSYDFMESVSPNKTHINSESHFLSTSQYRDMAMTPDYVRNCYWLATLHGMDVGLTWLWSRKPSGELEDRFLANNAAMTGSYPGSVNQQPQVANELTKTMMDLNAFSEEIMQLRRQKKPIRLFYTETSAINKSTHMADLFELYESLYFKGLPIGYATEKIITKQNNKDWEVILVYKTDYVTDSEFNALQTYLNNGGTVIIDNGRSLSKNEYGQVRTAVLTKGTGTLINMGSTAIYSQMKEKALEIINSKNLMPAITLNETNGLTKNGCMWRISASDDASYLVTIVNLGKNTATLKPRFDNGTVYANCTDMMTGKQLGNEFQLKSEGVLLLKVEKGEAAAIADTSIVSDVKVYGGKNKIIIESAANKRVQILNLVGQTISSKIIDNNHAEFAVPKGIMIVSLEGEKNVKVIVK